ncbi:hypothetical protein KI387_043015, partial [Taxus chinensis]
GLLMIIQTLPLGMIEHPFPPTFIIALSMISFAFLVLMRLPCEALELAGSKWVNQKYLPLALHWKIHSTVISWHAFWVSKNIACALFGGSKVAAAKRSLGGNIKLSQSLSITMGGAPKQTEPTCDPRWKQDEVLWNLLKIGGVSNFIERISGYDTRISAKFARLWKDGSITFRGVSYAVNEELIALVTGLDMDGVKFSSKRIDRKVEEAKFVEEGDDLIFTTGGILVSSIPPPFDEIARMMVRYITLEGRGFKVCFPHFILKSLEASIIAVKHSVGSLPLHQGVILLLHQHFLLHSPRHSISTPVAGSVPSGTPPAVQPPAHSSMPSPSSHHTAFPSMSSPSLPDPSSVPAPSPAIVPSPAPASSSVVPSPAPVPSPAFVPPPASPVPIPSRRILRSMKRAELQVAQDLLTMHHESPALDSSPPDAPVHSPVIASSTGPSLDDLSKDVAALKTLTANFSKSTGKRKVRDQEDLQANQVEEIYKKLFSLDSRIQASHLRHSTAMRAILTFHETQIKNICNLSNLPPTGWIHGIKKDIVFKEADKNDPAQISALGLISAFLALKAAVEKTITN